MSGESGTPFAELSPMEKLERCKQNADFWLEGARTESERDHAVMNAEQAINAWKNAAYAMAKELTAALSHNALQEAQIAGLREDAEMYKWVRSTATLRFDCGEWMIGFESWLPAQGDFPHTYDHEPTPCEPLIVDTAIKAAMREAK